MEYSSETVPSVRPFLLWPWLLAAVAIGVFGKLASLEIDLIKIPPTALFTFSAIYTVFPYGYFVAFVIATIKHRDSINLQVKRPSLISILFLVVAQLVLMGIGALLFSLAFGFIFNRTHP